ncbi:MAG: hypothetical protein ACRDQ2_00220 [Gaiellales bacterium]
MSGRPLNFDCWFALGSPDQCPGRTDGDGGEEGSWRGHDRLVIDELGEIALVPCLNFVTVGTGRLQKLPQAVLLVALDRRIESPPLVGHGIESRLELVGE